jgi:succinoglycan biosynthesis transport protein ExoP
MHTLRPSSPQSLLSDNRSVEPVIYVTRKALSAEFTLADYWRELKAAKWFMWLCAVGGVALGTGVSFLQAPIYRAHSALEIEEPAATRTGIRESPTETAVFDQVFMQTQVRALQSRDLGAKVLSTFSEADRAKLMTPRTLVQRGRAKLWPSAQARSGDEELDALLGSVSVRSPEQTRIVDLYCDATDAALASKCANAVAEQYIQRTAEVQWATSQHYEQWLQEQVAKVKNSLEQSERELDAYATQAGVLVLSDGDNATQELRALETELQHVEAEAMQKQAQFETANGSPSATVPQVLENGPLKDYQVRITDLRRQEAELATAVTAENPRLLKIRAQIEAVEEAADKERNNIVRRIQNEYNAASLHRALVAERYRIQAALVQRETIKTAQYNLLKRTVEMNQTIYESLLQKVKEYDITASLSPNQIRILDRAQVPGRPYQPNVFLNVSLGLASFVFLGGCVVIIRNRTDKTIRSPGEALAYLNIAELGVIPRLIRQERNRTTLKLQPCFEKSSITADSFRSVVASVDACRAANNAQVIAITSPDSDEGKSTTAGYLAIAVAETARRVLLIDADLRKPNLHNLFGTSNDCGFSDLLAKPANAMELIARMLPLLKTDIPGVSVLPAGLARENVPALFYSTALPALLSYLRQYFDTILIDTPPMGDLPDARIIGRLVDGMILVLRSNQTIRDSAVYSGQRLAADGIHLIGTVLTDWRAERSSTYYRHHYA